MENSRAWRAAASDDAARENTSVASRGERRRCIWENRNAALSLVARCIENELSVLFCGNDLFISTSDIKIIFLLIRKLDFLYGTVLL